MVLLQEMALAEYMLFLEIRVSGFQNVKCATWTTAIQEIGSWTMHASLQLTKTLGYLLAKVCHFAFLIPFRDCKKLYQDDFGIPPIHPKIRKNKNHFDSLLFVNHIHQVRPIDRASYFACNYII